MRKTDTNFYKVKNTQKYMGDPTKVVYRSSWELTVMNLFDSHPNIIGWGSEVQSIPYFNPVKNKWTVYVPDFIVIIDDGKNNRHVEMIEIKPIAQTPGHNAGLTESGKPRKVNKYTLSEQIKNEAKWMAARDFCNKRGWKFQVMTEQTLFGHAQSKGRR